MSVKESQWTPESLEGNCKGQNPLDWKVLYIIENILKFRCLKWAHMTHLDIWNTSYGQKKGQKSNCPFDSHAKSQKSTRFPCVRMTCNIPLKSSQRRLKLFSRPHHIEGLHTKLWGPKVTRVLTLAISKLPFGSLKTKCHLDVGLVERHGIYYKGEGGGFPKSRPWWVLWVRGCPWFVLTPKVLKLCTNQLVV
jgi:hypothetical protein